MRGRICGAISTTASLAPRAENRIQDGKGDKPCPHHDHGTALGGSAVSTPWACSSVQKLWTPATVRPGHRRAHRRRARRNQQIVVGDVGVIIEGQHVGLRIEPHGAPPQIGLDIERPQARRMGRVTRATR